jgi:dihydropteroate synthase
MTTLPPPKLPGGPYLMGILNVTPDSFSDGGLWEGARAAEHALEMLAQGADIIDIGGESTRPGAAPASEAEELARVLPVIKALRAQADAPISIDTMKPTIARAAVDAGATIWNDVNALRAPGAIEMAATLGVPVVLMHMQGEPRTMQVSPRYEDVCREVGDYLAERVEAAARAGVADIWVDLGFGFGKTPEHNFALLDHIGALKARTGRPVLIGASRKSAIERVEGVRSKPSERIGGSIALALRAVANGADMLRVHDVRETVQALKMWKAHR